VSKCRSTHEPDGDPEFEPPYAEVRQVGRWMYHVCVIHGVMQWGPSDDGGPGGWFVLGEKHAHRKAARVLRAYLRYEARTSAAPTRITSPLFPPLPTAPTPKEQAA